MTIQTRLIILLLFLLIAFSCTKEKPQGVNFLVVQKEDTISHFYYHGKEKYEIVGKEDSLELSSTKYWQINGELVLGVQDRNNQNLTWLNFTDINDKTIENIKEMSSKFRSGAYSLPNEYEMAITENYVDSSAAYPIKYETYAAIDSQSFDTLLFQEVFYMFKEKNVIGALIVYDNLDTREEMRLSLDGAIKAIKKSTKTR